LEIVLGAFETGGTHFDGQTCGYYHPGRSARAVVNGTTIAQCGQIHPDVAAARKLKQETYIAEIYLDRLFALDLRAPRYQPLSRFPAIDRDFSFLFAESVGFEAIQAAVRTLNIAELQSFRAIEIFRGGSVSQGKYSILLRAQFQSVDRTLRDDEVAQWSTRIIQTVEAVGGTLRS